MGRIQTKFGSIYKRGKIWWVYFKSARGVYVQESSGSQEQRLAKEYLENRFREEASKPVFEMAGKRRSFEDLAVKYCQDKNTPKSNLSYINRMVDFFGKMEPTEVRSAQIQSFLNKLKNTTGKSGKPLAQNTVNNYLRWLRAILRYGSELDWYSVYHLPRIKISKKGQNVRFRMPSEEELEKILELSPPHLKLTIQIAIQTGMRKGEILGLKWNQIHFEDGFIYLSPKHVKEQYPRWIPLIPELEKLFMLTPRECDEVVSFNGAAIRNIKTAWARVLREAKITDLHFHDLRHYARRFFRKAGVKPEMIKSILGHHSMEMSMLYDSVYGDDYEDVRRLCTKFVQPQLKIANS